jgi:hypothetical protein
MPVPQIEEEQLKVSLRVEVQMQVRQLVQVQMQVRQRVRDDQRTDMQNFL